LDLRILLPPRLGAGQSVASATSGQLRVSFRYQQSVYTRAARLSARLVPSLIEGLRVGQGLRVVPVLVYRYSMKFSLKKARSPGTTEGGRSD